MNVQAHLQLLLELDRAHLQEALEKSGFRKREGLGGSGGGEGGGVGVRRGRINIRGKSHSAIWGGGRGCNKFVPVLGGNDTKIVSTGDIVDQVLRQMR